MSALESPTSKAELEAALNALIRKAHGNGVEVGNGGYDLIDQNPATPDWDLTIIRME